MAEKELSPDAGRARQLLDELWNEVTQEESGEINKDIEKLIDSRFVSIRFCLPTQLLGKLTDPKLERQTAGYRASRTILTICEEEKNVAFY